MAVTTHDCVPLTIQGGDRVQFRVAPGAFSSASWTGTFYLSRNGTAVANAVATADGTGYLVTLTAAATAALTPGAYDYIFRVVATSPATDIETIEQGTLEVLPNLAATQSASTAQALLTALETAMATVVADSSASVSFNGQSFTQKDLGTLERLRTSLQAEVIREKNRAAAARGELRDGFIGVRFGRGSRCG